MEETAMSTETNVYKGTCFCGAIELTVAGEPVAQGYCHCGSCRHWSAGPVNAFSLWAPEAVRVTRGEDRLGTFNKSELSYRKFCTACGGHVFVAHPKWNVVDVPAAMIPDVAFGPKVHVNYDSTVMPIIDGLPKFADFPADMGGSGRMVAE
jgi:hypothetical protein